VANLIYRSRATTINTSGQGTFTNTANATDAGSSTYMSHTSTVSSGVGTMVLGGMSFPSVVEGDESLAVKVEIRFYVSLVARFASVTVQPFDGATPIGSPQTLTLNTSAYVWTIQFPVTSSQVKSSSFSVKVVATKAATTSSGTFYLDYIEAKVSYPVKPDTISDSFDTGIDTNIWSIPPQGTTWDSVNKRVDMLYGVANSSWIQPLDDVDLSAGSWTVKLTHNAPVGATFAPYFSLRVGSVTPRYALFVIKMTTGLLEFSNSNASNSLVTTSVTYDPVAHAYLRFRGEGSTLYWDTSPDALTWTNQRTDTALFPLSALEIKVYQASGGTYHMYLDDVNISLTPRSGRPKVWSGTAWDAKPSKVWNGTANVEKPTKAWTGTEWRPSR
jgi:hypothetical protein